MDRNRNANGTWDGAGVMADLTGLARSTIVDLAADVKLNQDMLNSCPYHEFAPILPRVQFNQRYRCIECGGDVNSTAFYWHELGRRAGPGQ